MTRQITKVYQDPVEIIWLNAATRCGIHVVRDTEVFASWDGQGVLRIGTPETLDPDDSLAQMILHEICHALVAGPGNLDKEDWGLDYEEVGHQVFEQAALRLQAALADEFELREFFASTTDFREYFDRLPANPLASSDDPASNLANEARTRLQQGSWSDPIHDALQQTRQIADLIAELVEDKSIWSTATTSHAGCRTTKNQR